MDSFRSCPRVPNEESATKPEKKETRARRGNPQLSPLEMIMQKMEYMELQMHNGEE